MIFRNQNRRRRYLYRETTQRTTKEKCPARGGKFNPKKSDCHLHATLKERLEAVYKLRFQHNINLLCKVLRVNRSTYYKHFSLNVAPRVRENQDLSRIILKIYADCDKRLGAYKIAHLIQRDYGLKISVGRALEECTG